MSNTDKQRRGGEALVADEEESHIRGFQQVVDFAGMMEARQLFFWRLFWREFLTACSDEEAVSVACATFVASEANKAAGMGLLAFLRAHVGPWIRAKSGSAAPQLLQKLAGAETALRRGTRGAV